MILLVACAGPGTAVHADDPSTTALLRETLERFDAALPRDSEVHIRAVRVGSVVGAGRARYRPLDRSIRLEPAADDLLRRNLVHELCHAADVQLGLRAGDQPIWTFADPRLAPRVREGRLAEEAFAEVCELGPASFALLDLACPDDDSLTTRTAAFLANVYGGEPAVQQLEAVAVASTRVPTGARLSTVTTADHAWALHLQLPDGGYDLQWVDPSTGQEASPGGDSSGEVDPQPIEAPTGWDVVSEVRADIPVGRLHLSAKNGATANRLWVDGAVGCPTTDEILVAWDGEVWGFEQIGETVAWHQWVPR